MPIKQTVQLKNFNISGIKSNKSLYDNRNEMWKLRQKLRKKTKGYCMYCYGKIRAEEINDGLDYDKYDTGVIEHYIDKGLKVPIGDVFRNYKYNLIYSCSICNNRKNRKEFREKFEGLYNDVCLNCGFERCYFKKGNLKCYKRCTWLYRNASGVINPIIHDISQYIEYSIYSKKFISKDPFENRAKAHIEMVLSLNPNKILESVCKDIVNNERVPKFDYDKFDNLMSSQIIDYFIDMEKTNGFDAVYKIAKKVVIASRFRK